MRGVTLELNPETGELEAVPVMEESNEEKKVLDPRTIFCWVGKTTNSRKENLILKPAKAIMPTKNCKRLPNCAKDYIRKTTTHWQPVKDCWKTGWKKSGCLRTIWARPEIPAAERFPTNIKK